jgi:aminopeptidase N
MVSVHNLRQDDAVRRGELLRVTGYDIALDLAGAAGGAAADTFRATTTVTFECARPGADTFIEAAAVRLTDATLNGEPVDLDTWSAESGLPLRGLAGQNTLTVSAEFPYSTIGRGLHRAVDPADGSVYLFTHFEPAGAQRAFACFDQPDLKAPFTFRVTVPANWLAVSNMPVESKQAGPGGATTFHFAPTPRMSTYIAAVCAGPYAEVRHRVDGRDLGIFVRPSLLPALDADEVFDVTRRGMDFFEAQFGQAYPLPKYDHVAVPEFAGAMENFGCVVFTERLLAFRSTPTDSDRFRRAMVVLHELAHMWFGDLVTLRWWDDLWLNEAFATWAAFWAMAEATDWPEPWAYFAAEIQAAGISADLLSTTHPVYTEVPDVPAIEVNFDAITYNKGASALKQLAAYVGIETFTAALRSYFAAHAWGSATFADLVGAMEAASGRPVREIASQWLETTGVNTLRPELSTDANDRYADVFVAQEAAASSPILRTHRIGIGLYDLEGGRLRRRERLDVEVSGARTEISELRDVPAADVLLLNDDNLSFAKVRLDTASMAVVRDNVAGFTAAAPRAACWAAAIDMLSDAELLPPDLIAMVRNGLPAEVDTGLVDIVLNAAGEAVARFADPAWAPTGWSILARLCREAAYAASPGSSLQLRWVRGFAATARTAEDVALLAAWLDGSQLPDGLPVEADLRWALLHGLVAAGAAGTDDIERESATDRTVAGRREAATARALLPTPGAKAAAWRFATDDPDASLDLRVATLTGFSHPAQLDLTAPFVPRFFEDLDRAWVTRGPERARALAVFGFPRYHVSDDTLARCDAWLAGDHRPSQLVRLVTEGRDKMRRALTARAAAVR